MKVVEKKSKNYDVKNLEDLPAGSLFRFNEVSFGEAMYGSSDSEGKKFWIVLDWLPQANGFIAIMSISGDEIRRRDPKCKVVKHEYEFGWSPSGTGYSTPLLVKVSTLKPGDAFCFNNEKSPVYLVVESIPKKTDIAATIIFSGKTTENEKKFGPIIERDMELLVNPYDIKITISD